MNQPPQEDPADRNLNREEGEEANNQNAQEQQQPPQPPEEPHQPQPQPPLQQQQQQQQPAAPPNRAVQLVERRRQEGGRPAVAAAAAAADNHPAQVEALVRAAAAVVQNDNNDANINVALMAQPIAAMIRTFMNVPPEIWMHRRLSHEAQQQLWNYLLNNLSRQNLAANNIHLNININLNINVNNNNGNNNNNNDDAVHAIRSMIDAFMTLSDQERQQAKAIQAAAREDEALALEKIPPMWFAHVALIDGDDVEVALNRLRHFQLLREEYQLQDTLEEGMEIMRAFFTKQPNAILNVSYNAIDRNYVYIYDQKGFDLHILKSPEDWRVAVGYCYYLFQAMSPDFFAIRQGCVFIGECEGYNRKMVHLTGLRKFWEEVFGIYPMRIREVKCFHSGVVANLLLSMIKPFFPKYLRKRINLGCQFPGRLDTYYSIPTREIAVQKTLADIESFLWRRYANERDFVL